jgi:hypothetical protein
MQAARNGAAIAVPYGSNVTAIDVGNDGKPFIDANREFDEQISIAILLQSLATGEGIHQSRAASQVHKGTLDMLVRWVQQTLANCIEYDILKPLVLYNYGREASDRLRPKAMLGTLAVDNFAETATAVAALFQSGYLHASQVDSLDAKLGLDKRPEPPEIPTPGGTAKGAPGPDDGSGGAPADQPPDDGTGGVDITSALSPELATSLAGLDPDAAAVVKKLLAGDVTDAHTAAGLDVPLKPTAPAPAPGQPQVDPVTGLPLPGAPAPAPAPAVDQNGQPLPGAPAPVVPGAPPTPGPGGAAVVEQPPTAPGGPKIATPGAAPAVPGVGVGEPTSPNKPKKAKKPFQV